MSGPRQTYTAETKDGWTLRLERDRTAPRGEPILLVHGLASTPACWYGGPSGGIGTALASMGRDVWAVQLRGGPGTLAPRGASAPIRMSDKLRYDLPAILRTIREITGRPRIDAVGHSMGGILLTLLALTEPCSPLRRLATIGSPLTMSPTILPWLLRSPLATWLLQRVERIPLAALSAQLSPLIPVRLIPSHFEPALAHRKTTLQVLREHVSDLFAAELAELYRWLRSGDPALLLPEGMAFAHQRMPIPTCFIVGVNDRLTPAHAVRQTYDQLACPHSQLHIIGRQSGYRYDYRHFDVLVGGRAPSEVTPLVLEWMGAAATSSALRQSA